MVVASIVITDHMVKNSSMSEANSNHIRSFKVSREEDSFEVNQCKIKNFEIAATAYNYMP
jgi:hypothetical protein